MSDDARPDADELPDGSSSDASDSQDGEDTVSGGGPDEPDRSVEK
jgi:hypothetical protein